MPPISSNKELSDRSFDSPAAGWHELPFAKGRLIATHVFKSIFMVL
jgi:hypothetical protein